MQVPLSHISKKKAVKPIKKTITVFFEHETITGTIDRILEWLSGYMVGKDQSPHAGADEKVLEITRKRIEEQKFVLATFFARYKEGDLIYTKRDLLRCTGVLISRAARAISPVIREDLDEPVDEISHSIAYPESPADDTAVALRSLETWNVLWENQLIEERGHDYYLRKKIPAGDCTIQVNTSSFPELSEEETTAGGLAIHIHLVGDVRYQVFMDSGIHFHLTKDEIKEGLKGLDVEDESLNCFNSSMEMKDLAIHAVLEVIRDKKGTSLETLGDCLKEYPVHGQDNPEVITLTVQHGLLSEIVTEMRKAGILAGSREHIHIQG